MQIRTSLKEAYETEAKNVVKEFEKIFNELERDSQGMRAWFSLDSLHYRILLKGMLPPLRWQSIQRSSFLPFEIEQAAMPAALLPVKIIFSVGWIKVGPDVTIR